VKHATDSAPTADVSPAAPTPGDRGMLSGRPWLRQILSMVRGLSIGACAGGLGWLTFYAIATFMPSRSSCDEDLGCLPDVGPFLFGLMMFPIVAAVLGPVLAWLLRARRPGLYATPAAWILILACVGSGPADQQDRWPYNSFVTSLVIFLIPYCVNGFVDRYLPARPRQGKRAAR